MKKFLLRAGIFGMLCSPSQAKTWWNYEASCTVTDVQPTQALPFETAGYTIRIAFDAKNPTKINNLQISPNADQADFVDVLVVARLQQGKILERRQSYYLDRGT